MNPAPMTRAQLRELDRRASEEYGLPTLVLMENAGRGAAEWLRPKMADGAPVLVLCGSGNNGGDGAVVARWLDLAGVAVRVVWFAEPGKLSSDSATQSQILTKANVMQEFRPGPLDRGKLEADLGRADWVVDGLLGTGLSRPVEGPLAGVIEAINASGKPVLSLDLPSGLDADTGRPIGGVVKATATATFAAPKVGFQEDGSEKWTGPVTVVPIGVPRRLLAEVGG